MSQEPTTIRLVGASIYLSSSEGYTGKSAVALGLIDVLGRTAGRVGVFRPIVVGDAASDDVLAMLLERVDPTLGLTAEECAGVTYDDVHDDPELALADIVARYKAIERRCDAVLIVGSDHTDVGNPAELAFNARVAANLGARVLLVISGRNAADLSDRTPAEIANAVEATLPELANAHAELAGVIVNRAAEQGLGPVREAVTATLESAGATVPVWTIPEQAILDAPSVEQLRDAVEGELYSGDEALMGREVLGATIAGMGMEHVLERLIEGGVVVIAADRTEILLGALMAHDAETFPSLACIVVNGPFPFSPVIKRLLAGVAPTVPIIRTELGTYETARRIVKTRGRVAASTRKIDVAISSFEQHVPAEEVDRLVEAAPPGVVTPLMFEYGLLDRARADRQRIVLPEGEDDRILTAASTLLARDVADLVILGDEGEIRARAAALGVDIEKAQIISPRDPALVAKFAAEYARLRAHKGVTVEQAAEKVTDVSYFGTMMVHMGLADGMVSGAAHTTAHTIKPGFEIVKTRPGVSIVSSVFLMALEDRVLVYGDCAVNPDPTAEQLADIAISSAETARQFGIEPRVAMLSYSTGESGAGADVDKVRHATELVRERAPQLLVEGPIQYDAATDMAVASKKMPGSEVAGRATVFIFPDLNTGNNTYKAVQRSAGALAIGPVLQGINAPINDLSRGALVSDIVNTVAITAIQAQAQAQPSEPAAASAPAPSQEA
ncbi:Phosphate acetyltransferase [Pseudoclavibacter triregionum]|nr:Phosphate acetyltransferase [Pseudoclavibacter triregionum]